MSIGKRLKETRSKLDLSQKDLAAISGVSQQTISNLESERNKGSVHAVKLAKALNVDPEWLVSGTPQAPRTTDASGAPPAGQIPLLSWDQAADWPLITGQPAKWVPSPDDIGPNSYALDVSGDSMTSPGTPSIPSGATIIIDPETPAQHGSLVIATLASGETVFRRLVIDGRSRYLEPLNPRYPMMEAPKDCQVIGSVRHAIIKL